MPIPLTGLISFSALRTEFGQTGPVSLSDYHGKHYENNTQCPTTGQLRFSELRGTGAPIDGTWNAYGSWSSWGACSVSCGGGTQSRSRTRTKNDPRYGGAAATGSTTENGSQACNTHSCVLTATNLSAFNGATVLESGGRGVRWTNNGSWTFTVPSGITTARIHVVGGGGGASGGGHGSGGGGGGAGGYKNVTLSAGQTYTVTVGNRGTHGHCTASSGSSSSFGSLITAGGGKGGRGGQSGCGLWYAAPGGSISGHTAGSSGGNGGANHDTNCGTYHGSSGGSYAGGGGGASPGWGCGNGPVGNGGLGGGYGGNGGRAANHDGNGRQDGFAYGGGGGAGSYPGGAAGHKGVVILQWDSGIKAPGG